MEHQLIGTSPQIVALRHQLNQLAQTDKDLMLEGEPGTGRHTLAELLHRIGARKEQSLQLHDCAAAHTCGLAREPDAQPWRYPGAECTGPADA